MRFILGPLPWERNDVGFQYFLDDDDKDRVNPNLGEAGRNLLWGPKQNVSPS